MSPSTRGAEVVERLDPTRTVVTAFLGHVRDRPDAPMLQTSEATYTFSQVHRDSDCLAVAMELAGVGRGDRVAIGLQNTPEFVVTVLAAWKLGAVVVPINPMYKARELGYILADAGARMLIADPSMRDAVDGARLPDGLTRLFGSAGRQWAVDGDVAGLLRANQGRAPGRIEVGATDTALLCYTSGTTGEPKGAMNTHANLVYEADTCASWFGLDPDADSILCLAPMFHITGMVVQLAVGLAVGCPLVLTDRFVAAGVGALVERFRSTFAIGATTAWIALMNDPGCDAVDFGSLVKAFSGGAPVPVATIERFEQRSGCYIHNAYGLTETTSAAIMVPLGSRAPVDPASGAVSIGVPLPGVSVRIVGDDGVDVRSGQTGEIAIGGPQVIPGYWHRPEQTASAIRDGYLYTGDMGFVDEEGWVYVVDRKKDMIIASGYKIWPREVEDVLYQHSAVREAAVVGADDPYRGQTVEAFVSLRAGERVPPTELIRHCRDLLAAYKCPTTVHVMDELPKTATGKVLRRTLRPT